MCWLHLKPLTHMLNAIPIANAVITDTSDLALPGRNERIGCVQVG